MSDEVPLTRRAAREAQANQRGAKKSMAKTAVPETAVPEVATPETNATPATVALPATPAAPATVALSAAEPQTVLLTPTVNAARKSTLRGFTDAVARHPNAWMYSSLGVIFLLLGTAAVFTGVAVGSAASASAPVTATPTPTPTRDAPSALLPATALRTCSIASLVSDPRLLTFEGSVINITTGDVLYDHSASVGAPPASGLKVLTAAAALMTIGPNYQIPTRVFEGKDPGTIVLVGSGDPTLSALPAGTESVYTGAPKMSDLAAQTNAAWDKNHPGVPITKVILDASYWNAADKWDPTWDRVEQRNGYQSEVTALMVDGDRANPQKQTSARGTDPIARAGDAFVSALGLSTPVDVVVGNATPGMPQLGEVKSQPIATLIGQMLQWSDNTLGENIARIVSKESGGDGSAASLKTIIPGIMANLGLDPNAITIRDGSGLSPNNLVPPLFMAQLMAKVNTSASDLGPLKSGLPVAGKSGSLASRFTGDNAVARGLVTGKTGWIDTSRTLSGWVNASDGSVLSFAFYALGPVQENATIALDTVTTGVFHCGNNLSNN